MNTNENENNPGIIIYYIILKNHAGDRYTTLSL